MCFGCSKEPSHRDGSYEYPQHMFWLRNKKYNFQLRTLFWGPVILGFVLIETGLYTAYGTTYSILNLLRAHAPFIGRVLDSGSRGHSFEPCLRHWVLSLSETLYALHSKSPDMTEKLLNGTYFLSSADFFFQNPLFRKTLSGIPSECQTDWIQIRPCLLSSLIWFQSVCKGYQQTTLVGNELSTQ